MTKVGIELLGQLKGKRSGIDFLKRRQRRLYQSVWERNTDTDDFVILQKLQNGRKWREREFHAS